MNNFIFYSPTEFVFGKDTEAQTGALTVKYGAKKVMIVYGGGSVIRSGLLSRVESSLKGAGILHVGWHTAQSDRYQSVRRYRSLSE